MAIKEKKKQGQSGKLTKKDCTMKKGTIKK